MSEHKYRLNYRLEPRPEGFDKEEAKKLSEEGLGSCDGMFLASIIWPEEGNTHSSTQFMSMDGRTGQPLDGHELFDVWMKMAKTLVTNESLDDGRRMYALEVFETYRKALLANREGHECSTIVGDGG